MNLNIGGEESHPDWHILNIQPGEHVDTVGDICDLPFGDKSIDRVYCSHVLEHLGYQKRIRDALDEIYRVLVPGGILMAAVPDMDMICRLFLSPQMSHDDKWNLQRILFGGQLNEYDFHQVGLTDVFLASLARATGFHTPVRVDPWGIFCDCSEVEYGGVLVSLNMEFTK